MVLILNKKMKRQNIYPFKKNETNIETCVILPSESCVFAPELEGYDLDAMV
jgi:hypothetical protein